MLTKACVLEHERAVKQAVLKQYPIIKVTTGFEYGYEITVGSLRCASKWIEYYVAIHKK
jgi:hypothetical protein